MAPDYPYRDEEDLIIPQTACASLCNQENIWTRMFVLYH